MSRVLLPRVNSSIPSIPRGWQRLKWAGFLGANILVAFVVFWPVILGNAFFCPVDIAANVFSKYRYLDPSASGVPANHYTVDMIYAEVPRNVLIHEAWRRGEMPWWDPYTDGGRPLAAEANGVNATDPIKVIFFHLLPFEAAYNWIRIIPFVLSGFFASLLLNYFRFSFPVAMWGGLLYGFAACNFLMFSGPTVQAGFVYYPLLWLLWDKAINRNRFIWFIVSGFVAALIFLSGNLQSHSYPFLFGLAFVLGYGWKHKERWGRLLVGLFVALTGGLGLAAPAILPQVELFLHSVRVFHPFSAASMLSGLVSLSSGFFPWVLGTFRTLDLSKFTGQGALGFWVYIGSVALIIVLLGATTRWPAASRENDWKRTALLMVLIYLTICSTPLIVIFYTRVAWLPVLGFAVLFAFGWERLKCAAAPFRRFAAWLICVILVVTGALNIFGLGIFPRVEKEVERRFLAARSQAFGRAEALRRFQVSNLPNEITFKNRETVAAAFGLLALGIFLWKLPNQRVLALNSLMVVNFLPLLWFGQRYVPMQPLAMWHELRQGGPEQQRVAEALTPQGLRLLEMAPETHDFVFPAALSQLFKVHSAQGYSSLMIKNATLLGLVTETNEPAYCDYVYRTSANDSSGELIRRSKNSTGNSRFHWTDDTMRTVAVAQETLTRLELDISPGPAADLIRADSYYPGWRIQPLHDGVTMSFEPPCFSRIHVPANVRRISLFYEPSGLRFGLWLTGGTFFILVLLLAVFWKQRSSA